MTFCHFFYFCTYSLMVMRMFKVNDYVTRKSYNNDTVFKIIDIFLYI